MIGLEEAGFCGDYCGKCPNYPQKCGGCVASDHMNCYFVKCCSNRGIEHCGFCPAFPCKKLSGFCPDDRPECPLGYHIENLRIRRVMGTEAWLKSQQKRWKK
jgi:hypothetical protein